MPGPSASPQFILSAFDREQWCPVLQARFRSDDLDTLRSIPIAAHSATTNEGGQQ
jgi:hypothetical protein